MGCEHDDVPYSEDLRLPRRLGNKRQDSRDVFSELLTVNAMAVVAERCVRLVPRPELMLGGSVDVGPRKKFLVAIYGIEKRGGSGEVGVMEDMLRIFLHTLMLWRNSSAKHFSFSGNLGAVVAAICALCVHVRILRCIHPSSIVDFDTVANEACTLSSFPSCRISMKSWKIHVHVYS